jgi:hypothetical protein
MTGHARLAVRSAAHVIEGVASRTPGALAGVDDALQEAWLRRSGSSADGVRTRAVGRLGRAPAADRPGRAAPAERVRLVLHDRVALPLAAIEAMLDGSPAAVRPLANVLLDG